MSRHPVLHGYRYSVYSWIARLALHEKGVAYDWQEVDPFATDMPVEYLDLHPFRRVPTLVHGDFALHETHAVTRYVDEAFAGPSLQPGDARSRARMNQIVSIVDSYGYWPLVRQVFAHGFFRACLGRPGDDTEIRTGLAAAPRVLGAIERLCKDEDFLLTGRVTLADLHLYPMIAYFAKLPEARAILASYPRLDRWTTMMANRETCRLTEPEWP